MEGLGSEGRVVWAEKWAEGWVSDFACWWGASEALRLWKTEDGDLVFGGRFKRLLGVIANLRRWRNWGFSWGLWLGFGICLAKKRRREGRQAAMMAIYRSVSFVLYKSGVNVAAQQGSWYVPVDISKVENKQSLIGSIQSLRGWNILARRVRRKAAKTITTIGNENTAIKMYLCRFGIWSRNRSANGMIITASFRSAISVHRSRSYILKMSVNRSITLVKRNELREFRTLSGDRQPPGTFNQPKHQCVAGDSSVPGVNVSFRGTHAKFCIKNDTTHVTRVKLPINHQKTLALVRTARSSRQKKASRASFTVHTAVKNTASAAKLNFKY